MPQSSSAALGESGTPWVHLGLTFQVPMPLALGCCHLTLAQLPRMLPDRFLESCALERSHSSRAGTTERWRQKAGPLSKVQSPCGGASGSRGGQASPRSQGLRERGRSRRLGQRWAATVSGPAPGPTRPGQPRQTGCFVHRLKVSWVQDAVVGWPVAWSLGLQHSKWVFTQGLVKQQQQQVVCLPRPRAPQGRTDRQRDSRGRGQGCGCL